MEVNSGEAASQETRPRRRTAGALLRQPSPPGDSAAGTARCASRGCRQVFGLMGLEARSEGRGVRSERRRCLGSAHYSLLHTHSCSTYTRRFPRHGASVLVAGSFPITAAGQCRSGANASPASRFNPVACDHRNRRAQHSGASRKRQHEMLCGTAVVDAMRVSRFGSLSPLGGEKVPEEPAPYWIRGRMRGRRGDDACVERFGIKNAVPIRRIGCPDSVRPSPAFGTLSPLRRERGRSIRPAAPRSMRPAPADTARTGRGSSRRGRPRMRPGWHARRRRAARRRPGWTGRCPLR